jgi:Holliday junction resolvasome RuvABC endonuclease subunit
MRNRCVSSDHRTAQVSPARTNHVVGLRPQGVALDDPRLVRVNTRILAIDPSIAQMGFAVMLGGGTLIDAAELTTPTSADESIRLWWLDQAIIRLIQHHGIEHVAVEEFTAFYFTTRGGKTRKKVNPKAMYYLKAAQTVVQLAALRMGVPLWRYPVNTWKPQKDAKTETQAKARALYKPTSDSNNVADAIMIAHHHRLHANLAPQDAITPDALPLAKVPRRRLATPPVGRDARLVAAGHLLDLHPLAMPATEPPAS